MESTSIIVRSCEMRVQNANNIIGKIVPVQHNSHRIRIQGFRNVSVLISQVSTDIDVKGCRNISGFACLNCVSASVHAA